MSLKCRLGFHRWRPVAEFPSYETIFGLECARCKSRRLSVLGQMRDPPGPPGSKSDIEYLAAQRSAQEWASEVLGITPAAIHINFT